ncbi:MAG: hypothetical protein IKN15_01855 [Bacteroidaceae bacterium]|nr:hypothetical protein [Bacteroidaceae bacterium]
MPQSSDAATSVTVPGFSSKAACVNAGEQYIKDAGTEIKLKKSNGSTHDRSVYYNYQCIEVK